MKYKISALMLTIVMNLIGNGCVGEAQTIVVEKNTVDTVITIEDIDGSVLIGDFSPIKVGNKWIYSVYYYIGTQTKAEIDTGTCSVTIFRISEDSIYFSYSIDYELISKTITNPESERVERLLIDTVVVVGNDSSGLKGFAIENRLIFPLYTKHFVERAFLKTTTFKNKAIYSVEVDEPMLTYQYLCNVGKVSSNVFRAGNGWHHQYKAELIEFSNILENP